MDLTTLTIDSADGDAHSVWFITEDKTPNQLPTCADTKDKIFINGTVITAPIKAMAYSPCNVDVGSMGNDTWNGSIYAGKFKGGGKFTLYGDPILLPGQTAPTDGSTPSGTGSSTLGTLVSQRDVP